MKDKSFAYLCIIASLIAVLGGIYYYVANDKIIYLIFTIVDVGLLTANIILGRKYLKLIAKNNEKQAQKQLLTTTYAIMLVTLATCAIGSAMIYLSFMA